MRKVDHIGSEPMATASHPQHLDQTTNMKWTSTPSKVRQTITACVIEEALVRDSERAG
jgi:hypothetical protein